MDRLFLKGLVEEIRPVIASRRIRAAEAARRGGLLHLVFDRHLSLVWSLLPEAAGLYLGEPPRGAPRRELVVTPGLKKSVSGAVVTGLEIAELDRVVTLSLEQTKLSGKAARAALILEQFAQRVDLYLVDESERNIVEAFTSSRAGSRLGPGEAYRAPPPPPGAAPLASDGDEVAKRLAAAGWGEGGEGERRARDVRDARLKATGMTPLLVREMGWLVDARHRSEPEAFDILKHRLEEKRPVLYVSKDGDRSHGPAVLPSPIVLESETRLEPYAFGEAVTASFSRVMAEAATLVHRSARSRAMRKRLSSPVSKRLTRARRLRQKLVDERAALPEPSDERRKGEQLLAGLHRARRSADGRTVTLPDLFDPEEREIVLDVDPRLPLAANAQRSFTRARKSTRAVAELSKRIAATEDEIRYLESFEYDLANAVDEAELDELEEAAREQGLVPEENLSRTRGGKARVAATRRLPPRAFRSHCGHPILVGRSGRSNDETTFDIAGPDDLWLHAEGTPGAHVILRLRPGAVADEREVEEAAALAAYFSKRRNDTAVDVLVTARRNVARIKGAPKGLVKVARAKTVRVAPRLLPEEPERPE